MMERDPFRFKEEEQDVILTVRTLAPTKWMLLDKETGQIYQGSAKGHWNIRRINNARVKCEHTADKLLCKGKLFKKSSR
jgi:hypothetical protein